MAPAPVGPAQENFASVLAAAKAGAAWACRDLWQRFAPSVAAFARARGSLEPEDLTSEVFLTVFDRLDQFEGGGAEFRSFVFTVAHRRLVDELRARSRRPAPAEFTEDSDHRLTDSAETQALDRIADREVRTLIETLAPDQRDVLALRIIGGLSIPEIAQILDKRPGAVKALQRRGLETLRKKILPARTLSTDAND